jgi:hypothetical protein
MTTVELTKTELIVRVEGFDKLWALKSELRVPLAHVSDVHESEAEARKWFHGVRVPGAEIPGVLTAGTFYWHGDFVFWDVHHAERAIAIELHDEKYRRLVIEVEDPAATMAAIKAATKT